jgi:hypothetical protein
MGGDRVEEWKSMVSLRQKVERDADAVPLTKQHQIGESIDPRLRLTAIERQEVEPTEGCWMSRQRHLELAEAEMRSPDSEWEALWRDTV